MPARNGTNPSLNTLVGQPVSHVWFGNYSALYLELGALNPGGRTRHDGASGNPQGEFTVHAGFDWRIERPRSIFGSRDCSCRRQRSVIAKLIGTTVIPATISGRLSELQIGISNGMWIATFDLFRGDPGWCVSFHLLPVCDMFTCRGGLQRSFVFMRR